MNRIIGITFILALFLFSPFTQGSTCPFRFYDPSCTACDLSQNTCTACATGYALEDSSGLCHAYSDSFQSDGQAVYYNNAFYNTTRKRVQMLDPYCIAADLTALATSNTTVCGSCTGFKDNIAQRYISEDTTACFTTCAYSSTPRYPNGNKCAQCQSTCFECTTGSNCGECSYTKKRISGTVTASNFLTKKANSQIVPATDCTEARDATITKTYYVTPASSSATYWTDLNQVFYDVFQEVANYQYAEINIYLLKDGTNLMHYLLDGASTFLPRLSERTQTVVQIMPRYCSDESITGCLDEGEKPTIKWKSDYTNIFVTKSVTMSNIIIDGADMVIDSSNACRSQKQECCTGPSYSETGCSPTDIAYDDWNLDTTVSGVERKYGIFVFQYITDAPNLYVPELSIQDCEIRNFIFAEYYTSFIEFDRYGGTVNISNTIFDRFLFPHGLISNAQLQVDRNYDPLASSFTQITCRKINLTYQGDCYGISLESSTFTNYNPLQAGFSEDTTSFRNHSVEGAVLTLHNFDGPIVINDCLFQNILSYSRYWGKTSSYGNCGDFDFINGDDFLSVDQASHDIIDISKYKLFLDKHFRKYYQASLFEQIDTIYYGNYPTTGVIHLRNVTKGLVIHDSTFDQVHSVAGGSIFIYGFNNTYDSPIVITENDFTNNFAELFALNILIYKEQRDIPNLNCTGILISDNNFADNYGCLNTLANIAVACEATTTSAEPGFDDTNYDSYYTGYTTGVDQNYQATEYADIINFTNYMENVSLSLDTPHLYTHPFDDSIQFNSDSVQFSNNIITNNHAILSNGFYAQGIMNLLIENNTLSGNSVPLVADYTDTVFSSNVMSQNGITIAEISSTNIMKESSPIVIRSFDRVIFNNNTFDGNTQGFWGGDFHIAQAITLAGIIGREPILINNCTFTNHQGFESITDLSYPDYAGTALITFNYWESLELSAEYTTAVVNNLFTIKDCTFSNNIFGYSANADTKLIYYKGGDNAGIISPLYENPFAYFLKYFFEGEVSAVNITSKAGQTVSPNDPVTGLSYFKSLIVSVQGADIRDNNLGGFICGFNNYFYPMLQVTDSVFTANTVQESTSSPNGVICGLHSTLFDSWDYTPEVEITRSTFVNSVGTQILANEFYSAITTTGLSPYYRFRIEDLESTGETASLMTPIVLMNSKYISGNRMTYSGYQTKYGFLYASGSSDAEFKDIVVFDSYGDTAGIMYLLLTSNVFIVINATGNSVSTTDITPSYDDEPEGLYNPDYTRALIYVAQGDNLVIDSSSFYDNTISCIFKVYSSASLTVQNSNITNYQIDKTLSWASLSATLEFSNCIIEGITVGENALCGIAALDTSTFILNQTNISNVIGGQDIIMEANLSTITFTNSRIEQCQTTAANGLITAKLGDFSMTGTTFSHNTGTDSALIYVLLLSSFQVQGCIFDSNSAANTHKLFDIKKLPGQATFIGSTFFDPTEVTIDINDQDAVDDNVKFTTTFMNVFDTDVSIDDCTFIGGLSTGGAINLLAETYNVVINNSRFHNNIGPIGSIGGIASLAIENTLFYGNTGTISLTGGTNVTMKQVRFQEEKSQSVYLSNLQLVEFDGVTFDGAANLALKLPNIQYWDLSTRSMGSQINSVPTITVKSSTFMNLNYTTGDVCGGAFGIYNSESTIALQSTLLLTDSTFSNIQGNRGVAICIMDIGINVLAADIVNTVIDSCLATGSSSQGAGIFYHSYDDPNVSPALDYLRVSGATRITNNVAYYKDEYGTEYGSGGGIYYGSRRPVVDASVVLQGNSAHYGPNYASYPVRISSVLNPSQDVINRLRSIIEGNTPSSRMLRESCGEGMDDYYLDLNGRNLAEENPVYLTSGADSDPFPLVGLYDADNQIVGSWSDATLKISFSDSSVIKETSTTFTAIEGYFPLYPLRLIYAPGQSVDATLTTSISIVSGGQTKVIPITLITKASFRNCSRGERLTDSRECYACDPGQYILARDSIGVCQGCPDHLKCFGGDDIGPEAGYWRFDGWKVTALKCLNAGACLGHTVDPNKQGVSCKEQRDPAFCYTGFCQKGYEGNLCSSCIDGYALSGGTFCVPCTNNPMFYVVLVIVVIVAIFFIIFTVRNALKVKEATKLNKPKTSILIKIFLNYVQLVSIVGSFQFQWPDQIQQMFKVQDKVATGPSEAFSVDCLLPGQSADSRTFFMKLLLISVSPLVLIVCGTIVWAIIFWLKKAAFDRLFKSNLTTTFVVLLFMLHSTLVQNSIIAFRCQNIGDTESGNQEYYLERDLQVQCWGRQHMLWIFICALPAFLIWGIGTPVFAFFVLKRNLHKLENIEFKSKYGFLYDGYKKQKYYWEFVILYRKIAMIFISVFMVTVGIKIQSLCVLGVCFLCYLLQIYGVPFEDQNLNYMERRALINATVTLYCGIYYVTGDLPQWVNWLLLVVILALNIWFFVIWFKSLVLEFLKERKAAKAQQELEKKAKKEAQEGKVQDGDEIQKLEVDGESPKKQKTLGKEKKPFLSYFKKKKKDNPIRINQA